MWNPTIVFISLCRKWWLGAEDIIGVVSHLEEVTVTVDTSTSIPKTTITPIPYTNTTNPTQHTDCGAYMAMAVWLAGSVEVVCVGLSSLCFFEQT